MALGLAEFIALGAFAGFTIFLGLPVALVGRLSPKSKGFLNAVAIGILVFLLTEIIPQAQQIAQSVIVKVPAGKENVAYGATYEVAVIGGLALGILSLVFYERRFLRLRPIVAGAMPNGSGIEGTTLSSSNPTQQSVTAEHMRTVDPRKIAIMIAGGIGIHNFSEGLAIGQEYASHALTLALLLVIGFALHNATEGFGIAAPLVGLKPKVTFLGALGLLGGGPTLLGTILGSVWASDLLSAFVLSLAGGAIIYIVLALYTAGRKQTTNSVLMSGILVGFVIGYLTGMLLILAQGT